MFIIFGTRGITMKSLSGTFHCPNCGSHAPFEQKNIRRFFTLFFTPVIPLDKITSFVECQRCRGQFHVDVMNQNLGPDPVANPVAIAGFHSPPPLPSAAGMMTAMSNNMPNAMITSRSNGMATASLVLGIISLVTTFLFCPAMITAPLALIFGTIGLLNSKSQFGIVSGRGKSIAGLSCAVASIAIIAIIAITAEPTATTKPQLSQLDTIKDHLSQSASSKAYGNTNKAIEIAAKMEASLRLYDGMMFDNKNTGKGSAKYVVHCEQHEKTCAFLIFVPNYRKFDKDAEKAISEFAWNSATELLAEEGNAPDTALCVALKGMVLFGAVMTGTVADETPQHTSKVESDIERFLPKEKPPTPTDPLKETPAEIIEKP